ncbi:MAG: DUF3488 and transglutaminase-like domain-containing protein [Dissulfurispiraceae bacterium]|jgi:transglutaminase-like putative cysteine protease|nr:DUF3488 and transglutaminase-like domain-containing protein [Dissulfurispiraceae bacterium]
METDNRRTGIRQVLDLTAHCIVLAAFLSVVRSISLISSSIFVAAYIAGSYASSKKIFITNRIILNLAALLIGAVMVSRASLNNLGGPVVDLLLLFLVIKVFEQKMFRDYMQIYALSVLLLAASSLFVLDMIFAVYFVVMLFLIAIGAVMLSYFSQNEDMIMDKAVLRKIISRSVIIPAVALPLTAVMFIILPRTAFPVWNMLTKHGIAHSGFSDSIELGAVSSIQESRAVVLRVKTVRVPEEQLYWRGIMLDSFNGRAWSASTAAKESAAMTVQLKSPWVRQSIFLEPYGSRYLFALDKPYGYSAKKAKYLPGLVAVLHEIPRTRIRYDAVSHLSDHIDDAAPDPAIYLGLPEKGLENTARLARSLTEGLAEQDAANRIVSHLNIGEYSYSLSSLPLSENPVEEFLFRSKKGNCEYFASSMAVMLRMSGIPSRIVGGYRGGQYNEIGGYYIVTQNEAHVWVEAYIPKRGWVRFDPTPLYPAGHQSSDSRSIFMRIKLAVDVVSYFWNSSVIPYNFEEQYIFLSRIKSGLTRADIVKYLKSPAAATAVFLICAVYLFFRIKKTVCIRKKEPYKGFISSFDYILTKRGYKRNSGEGLEEFVKRIKEPELKIHASNFADEFYMLYYKDITPGAEQRMKLRKLLKTLKKIQ